METKNSMTLEIVNAAQTALNKLHSRCAELEEENARLKAEKGEATDSLKETHDTDFLKAEKGEATDSLKETHDTDFDCLAVTNVQVYPFRDGPSMGHIKGLASIVLNDQFLIRGLRVMEGENGIFVGYPVNPFFKGEEFCSVCNPITRQLREHIENCVLEKYQASIV